MSTTAGPVLVDDFNDNDLSNFTSTVILNNATGFNVGFSATDGKVSASSTDATPEQVLFLQSSVGLDVGQTIILNTALTPTSSGLVDDFGLAIASTATPTGLSGGATGDTRTGGTYSFLFVAARSSSNEIRSAGSNGTTNFATDVDGTIPEDSILGLFIKRTTSTTYDLGYINATNVFVPTISRTVADTNLGTAIGFYGDLRGATLTVGGWDNLVLIPEPSAALLGACGMLAILRRRRA